jgi:hypothetical protein
MLLHDHVGRGLNHRRVLISCRDSGIVLDTDTVMEHLLGFAYKLQRRYPFAFAVAYRDFKSESNKQIQERLTCHYLFGAVGELLPADGLLKNQIWTLGGLLSKQVAKGGENFRPVDFTPGARLLAQEIGEATFVALMQKEEELALRMKFSIGPVNSAEHAICWCFRYVRQLFQAAKWESKHQS